MIKGNNILLKRRKKKINKLLNKSEKEWTITDKVEVAYYKYGIGEKITYDEFVLMLGTGDELYFIYQSNVYDIYYECPNIVIFYTTIYEGSDKVSSRKEKYCSISDMLEKVRINNKKIKEIWNDCKLG